MVKADVIYKIKQSNGTITKYKEQQLEADTYDEFLTEIEKEVIRLKDSLGRTIRFDVENFVREDTTPKSSSMKAKEAISYIKSSGEEDLDEFLSEDEDRITVLKAYENKTEEKQENKNR